MAAFTPVATDAAPAAIGPYSQAVVCDGWVFVSGQVALDPESGGMVEGGVDVQARRVLQNVRAVLGGAGADLASVVRTTIYLRDMADFPTVNEVYAEFFDAHFPARACVEVSRLPKESLIEVDAVARITATRP